MDEEKCTSGYNRYRTESNAMAAFNRHAEAKGREEYGMRVIRCCSCSYWHIVPLRTDEMTGDITWICRMYDQYTWAQIEAMQADWAQKLHGDNSELILRAIGTV